MIGKGWPSRRKAAKPKPLPRAYIKVGCHHPAFVRKGMVYYLKC